MKRLLKLNILITIALLFYSTSCYANDNQHSFTGEQDKPNIIEDSVYIAYNDLRIVNSKLIELEYTKQINNNLRQVISNDSIIIKDYTNLNNKLKEDIKHNIKQRNIALGIGIFGIITTILVTILK